MPLRALVGGLSLVLALVACSSSSKNPDATGGAGGGSGGGGSGGVAAGGGTSGAGGTPSGGAANDAGDAALDYFGEVMSDGPKLYWRELGVAPQVDDVSNNGNHGTFAQCVKVLPKAGNPAIDLCGGWIEAGDVFDFAGTVPFSFEIWIKPSASQTNEFPRVVSKENETGQREGWDLLFNFKQADGGPANLVFERWTNGVAHSTVVEGAQALLPTTRFTHLVITYDGATSWIYFDGKDVAQKLADKPIANTAGPFHVGADATDSMPLWAHVDEIAVYDKPLPIARIQTHYARGIAEGLDD